MSRIGIITVAATAVLLGSAAQAMPTIDELADPQLFIGPLGSTSPPGGTAIGGESNLITSSSTGVYSFTIGAAGGANTVLQSPTFVLLAMPTGATVTLESASCIGTSHACGLASVAFGFYGLTTNDTVLTDANSGTDTVYDVTGLAAGGSEQYGNYVTAAGLNGLPTPAAAGPYIVEVFAIPTGLTGDSTFDVTEIGAPAGTFVSAYSCETSSIAGAPCYPSGTIGESPLTNAGLLTPDAPPSIAEPASLVLLGFGLLGMGAVTRRRRGI